MKKSSYLTRFLIWRAKNINDKQFILFLSAIIGILVGFAAVIIKNIVHFIQTWVSNIATDYSKSLYIIFPVIGILITVLFIKYINKRPVRHGIPSVLYSISKGRGKINTHNLYSSIITSALTVGFGGSVGLEGPTVATGAAIGSNIGKWLQLNYKQVILLLGCASAGAMASIFKAPIAAIVFALEVIMLDLTMAAIVPLLISSVTGALTSYFFLGQNVLYSFHIHESFQLNHIPYYLILGFFAGLLSVYFTKMYMFISNLFERWKNYYVRLLIGGILLGLLVFLFPALYGEGYEITNQSLGGKSDFIFDSTIVHGLENNFWAIIVVFIFLFSFKVIATSITFGSGGVGGIFAPTLFTGAIAGLFFATLMNHFGVDLPLDNFALVGMAGLIAGVIHAPLTSIFLVAEISGGYELFMPLMIVSTISYATIKAFIPNSVYTIQLAKRGELMTHHKDKAVLMMLDIDSITESDFNTINPSNTLGDLIKVITKAHRNIFPVVEKNGTFRGIVKMDDIRHIMFNREIYEKVYVRDLMFMPDYVIEYHEPVEEIARKFHDSGRYNIAVLKRGKYIGFVSRAKLFSTYRKMLKDFSEH
jgi:CIC family chloride channel protein